MILFNHFFPLVAKMSRVASRLEVHRTTTQEGTAKPPRDESLRDCRLCKSEHSLRKCVRFRKMSVGERWKTVKKYKYCFNCLAHSHMKDKCSSRERCLECMSEHHTLLHHFKKRTSKVTRSNPRAVQTYQPNTEVDVAEHRGQPQSGRNKKRRNNKHRGRNNNHNNITNQHHQCCTHQQPHRCQQLQQLQQQQLQPQTYGPQQSAVYSQPPATIVINVHSGRVV